MSAHEHCADSAACRSWYDGCNCPEVLRFADEIRSSRVAGGRCAGRPDGGDRAGSSGDAGSSQPFSLCGDQCRPQVDSPDSDIVRCDLSAGHEGDHRANDDGYPMHWTDAAMGRVQPVGDGASDQSPQAAPEPGLLDLLAPLRPGEMVGVLLGRILIRDEFGFTAMGESLADAQAALDSARDGYESDRARTG